MSLTLKSNEIGQIKQNGQVEIYTWTINGFCDIRKQYPPGQELMSPTFYSNDKFKWKLLIYSQGEKTDTEKNIIISLIYLSFNAVMAQAQITFAVIDNGIDVHIKSMQKTELPFTSTLGVKYLLKSSDIDPILFSNNNKLIIKCQIDIKDISFYKLYEQKAQIQFFDCFEQLLDNKKFSDVILIADGKQIFAHKNILTIHSNVFAAMFEYDMIEKKKNIIEIKDISLNVLKEMLRYIYVRKVNGIADIASDLFVAADKFLLQNLKDMCEDTLRKGISVSNVFEYVEFAETHNAPNLKADAIQYIVSNAEKFIESESQSFGDLNSCIINEIFKNLVIQRVK